MYRTDAGGGRDCSELVDNVPGQEVHVVVSQGDLNTPPMLHNFFTPTSSVVNPDPVGSGTFFSNPKLFVSDPDPARKK